MSGRATGRAAGALAIALATLLIPAPTPGTTAEPAPLVIKLGTVAPFGTIVHKSLLELAEVFSAETGGRVRLQIYPGSVGDEAAIVRKLRIGQLHAATLTSKGLALITTEQMAVQLPMLFDDTDEMDAVVGEMQPTFDRALEEDGYVALFWCDGGWIQFFTRRPAVSVADVKGMRMWMWPGDPHAARSFALLGFEPVILSDVDVIPSLQTGLVEVFPTTPVTAVALGSYPLTPHLIDVRWGSMLGGTIVTAAVWQQIDPAARERIRARARQLGRELTARARADAEASIAIMRRRGLTVHTPTPAQLAEWRARSVEALAVVRGKSVDAALADRAVALRDAYRARQSPLAPASQAR
ncbi:MAG: TRAP transporter substrate-binding protein DctP [Deltaproteobacteria bacterium]|nr:TRAP transporter substrate-binding protein DctP [Deltaproteobacteria bacterium]